MNGFGTRQLFVGMAVVGALALTLISCGGPAGPVDGAKAYAHVEKIVELSPRPPGSEALKKTASYLAAEITKLGLTPREQTWTESVQAYGKARDLELRNVWTEIPGKDPDGPILLLACHYDSKECEGHPDPAHNFEFVGAIDGGGASGVLLELARVLSDHQKRARAGGGAELISPNIWIVWFDGEECVEFDWSRDKALSLMGSRHFARTMSGDKKLFPEGLAERMRVMVLLDLIGDKNIKIDRDTRSSGQLLEIFAATAERMGEKDRMFLYDSPMTDDHEPFKDFGVTVIDLIDFRWRAPAEWAMSAEDWQRRGVTKPADGTYAAWWHTPEDTLDKISPASLAFVGNLVWHSLPVIDQKFYAK